MNASDDTQTDHAAVKTTSAPTTVNHWILAMPMTPKHIRKCLD